MGSEYLINDFSGYSYLLLKILETGKTNCLQIILKILGPDNDHFWIFCIFLVNVHSVYISGISFTFLGTHKWPFWAILGHFWLFWANFEPLWMSNYSHVHQLSFAVETGSVDTSVIHNM